MYKTKRINAIIEVIKIQNIESQEALRNELTRKGFSITQATLSRDLKHLNIVKIVDINGKYKYVLPGNIISAQKINAGLSGLVSLEFSMGFGVIRTLSGFANSVAAEIDEMNIPELLATLAGNDTILLIPREGVSRDQFKNTLNTLIERIT